MGSCPSVLRAFAQRLIRTIQQLSFRFGCRRRHRTVLHPCLITHTGHKMVNHDHCTSHLQKRLQRTTNSHGPILVFNRPKIRGSGLTTLIRFNSQRQHGPVVGMSYTGLRTDKTRLFNQIKNGPNLLTTLRGNALILDGPGSLGHSLIRPVTRLLHSNACRPLNQTKSSHPILATRTEVVLVSRRTIPRLSTLITHAVGMPPLHVHGTSVRSLIGCCLTLLYHRDHHAHVHIAPRTVHHLRTCSFPGGLQRLTALMRHTTSRLINDNLVARRLV